MPDASGGRAEVGLVREAASRAGTYDEIGRVERQIANLFDQLFSPVSPFRSLTDADGTWHPFSDVFESERAFIIRMELAGIDRSSLSVLKEGQCLIVRGRREDPLQTERLTCHQLEISQGAFERVLCLPTDFREQDVRAEYEASGFLHITVPKVPSP